MDISKINLVNESTKIKANYELGKMGTAISLLLNKDNDLLIVGHVDDNTVIYWVSLGKTSDREQNEAIFNHIAYEPFEAVALKDDPDHLWGKIFRDNNWYYARLNRDSQNNRSWSTPFGYYASKLIGDAFARELASFPDVLLRKCRLREADGAYEKVLDYYLDEMAKVKDKPNGYKQVEKLIRILRQDDYLVLSPNEQIREKYICFLETKTKLYNQYMSVDKG